MSKIEIREELHEFIEKADDRLLNMIYAMVHADLTEDNYQLSDDHKKILDDRIKDHEISPTTGATWDKVKTRVENQI